MIYKALALLIAGHFVTDINTGALPAFLPFIKDALNLSYTMTATIILAFNLTSSVIQPFFGYVSDRWSVKWLLPVGPILASLGLGLIGVVPSFAWILLFASLSGLGQATYHPEGFKTVSLLSEKKKASMISIFHFGGNLGFAVGPILATFFFVNFGLQGSLFFVVPGIIVSGLLLITPSWRVEQPPPEPAAAGMDASGTAPRYGAMVLLLAVVVLRSAARLGVITFAPFYFITIQNLDPLVAGKYLSAFLLAGTVGIVSGGPIADRYGYKKSIMVTLGLSTVFLYLFFFTEGTQSFVFFILAGLMIIASNSVTMALGQSLMPRQLGMASGLVLGLAMGIGGITATMLGWVADQWGIPVTLQISFVMPLAAFFLCYFLPEKA